MSTHLPRERESDGSIRVAGPASGNRPDRLGEQAPPRPLWRYRLIHAVLRLCTRAYSSPRLEGLEILPAGPAILCFSHQNWIDPLYVLPALPVARRIHFFGPEQADMTRGLRNRMMRWGGLAVPYRPGKRGLLAATRRVEELLAAGDLVAIAGEGRIHAGEAVILPLLDGPAHMALRSGVPLVPVAINGTSWLAFRRPVRVRIGRPIMPSVGVSRRPDPEAVRAMTAQGRASLLGLVEDFPDPPRSRWLGGRLTELFNDWPEGTRPQVPPR